MANIFEGLGKPKIIFTDGSYHILPEPNGSGKEGLRLYDFEHFQRDQYWSEGGKEVLIGKKFIFVANLSWLSIPKESLKKLWKAQEDNEFTFILNIDKVDINYKCKVSNLQYRFIKGIQNHSGGYSINLQLKGTELISAPGYSTEISDEGFGSDFGGNTENQSP